MSASRVHLCTDPTRPGSRCSIGCGRPAELIVSATFAGAFAGASACPRHEPDAGIAALRLLADELELQLAERRRRESGSALAGRVSDV